MMDDLSMFDAGPRVRRMGMAELEGMGRHGDTELAHVTPGEVVVPVRVAQDPQFKQDMMRAFGEAGMDVGRYVVGGQDDSMNPQSGLREYFEDFGGMGVDDSGSGDGNDPGDYGGASVPGHDYGGYGVEPGNPASASPTGGNAPADGYGEDMGDPTGGFFGAQGPLGRAVQSYMNNSIFGKVAMGIPQGLEAMAKGGLFGDADKDGFIDDGPFAGMSVEHSYPGDEGYGGMTAAEQAAMGGPDDYTKVTDPNTGQTSVIKKSGIESLYTPGELDQRTAPVFQSAAGGGSGGGFAGVPGAGAAPVYAGSGQAAPVYQGSGRAAPVYQGAGQPAPAWGFQNDAASSAGLDAFEQGARSLATRSVQADSSLFGGQAAAGVNQQFDQARQRIERDLVARGVQPGSGAWQAAFRDLETGRAAAVAGARTQAGVGARERLTRDRLAYGDLASRHALGREGLATQRYGIDTDRFTTLEGQATQRYGIDANLFTALEGQATQRYGIDTSRATDLDRLATQRYGIDTGRYTSDADRSARELIASRSAATQRYGIDSQRYLGDRGLDLEQYLGDRKIELGYEGLETEREIARRASSDARKASRDSGLGGLIGGIVGGIFG